METTPQNSKQSLKKHVGTIEISNPLSLVQRKAFSLLLFNAYQDLERAEGKMHSIPMKAFCELLGYNSRDFKTLDKQIEKLQFTKIEWIENPDEFSRVSFFAYTGQKDGKFQYRFAPELEKKLYSPEIYAKINILALSQFESRYALALYENLARYRPNKVTGFEGGSPKWTVDEFRNLMGVSSIRSYDTFKELNRSVITPAISEINAVSDLKVQVHKIKKGRSIAALKFEVADNPQQSLALIPEPKTVENEATNPLAKEMNELYGVPPLKAGEWIIQFGEDRFKEVLAMAKVQTQEGNLKNPIGYITKCFKEGWQQAANPQEAEEKLKQKKKEQARLRKEAKLKEQAQKEAKELQELDSYVESLHENQKQELFESFYDDSLDYWKFTESFPIARGEDPKGLPNETLHEWWYDFLKKEVKV